MLAFLFSEATFPHTLAVLVLVSRLGDISSTLLVTPTLALEANQLVRRFRRTTLVLGLALALVPYYNTALGIVVLVPSLFVTGSNLIRGWVAHALGETELQALLHRAARQTTRLRALSFVIGGAFAFAMAGALLMLMSGGPAAWAYWFAYGILAYALAIAIHGTFFLRRVFGDAGLHSARGV
jgi:hypothetical protein